MEGQLNPGAGAQKSEVAGAVIEFDDRLAINAEMLFLGVVGYLPFLYLIYFFVIFLTAFDALK